MHRPVGDLPAYGADVTRLRSSLATSTPSRPPCCSSRPPSWSAATCTPTTP
ncbi:hypothetical protein LV779_17990 [Streptomyces thinghirensis]|nr:hypothetical protein [Streptomyces thinghirensis]